VVGDQKSFLFIQLKIATAEDLVQLAEDVALQISTSFFNHASSGISGLLLSNPLDPFCQQVQQLRVLHARVRPFSTSAPTEGVAKRSLVQNRRTVLVGGKTSFCGKSFREKEYRGEQSEEKAQWEHPVKFGLHHAIQISTAIIMIFQLREHVCPHTLIIKFERKEYNVSDLLTGLWILYKFLDMTFKF